MGLDSAGPEGGAGTLGEARLEWGPWPSRPHAPCGPALRAGAPRARPGKGRQGRTALTAVLVLLPCGAWRRGGGWGSRVVRTFCAGVLK